MADTLASESSFSTKSADDHAVLMKDASFAWEAPPPEPEDKKKTKKKNASQGQDQNASKSGLKIKLKSLGHSRTPSAEKEPSKSDAVAINDQNADKTAHIASKDDVTAPELFGLSSLNAMIPKGALVAIVGPVGSGKSSLLQGLVGEMRKSSGTIELNGSVSYASQVAWIQNCSIRENILFGQPMDEERYLDALRDACLEEDLRQLQHGDNSQIGEKGINLSGGQKQRVCPQIKETFSLLIKETGEYCSSDLQQSRHLSPG